MEFLLLIFGIVTFGVAWRARSDAQHTRKLLKDVQDELAAIRRAGVEPVAQASPVTTAPPLAPTATAQTAPAPAIAAPAPAPTPAPFVPPPRRPPPPPPQWLLAAKAWLFGGNLVAKLGLLILFIGISFLLKYTAARVTLPIEFRLAGIVLADIVLLAWGWRIRLRRPAISLPVQGAALAVLMLVTFGAFRLYHLIPGSLAFALLFVLTVFTCVLAVLQDAMWLAIFGIVGGFAAPILASSGGGSHIGLFSYYALLNAGVFALALMRSWRPLNLLGFAFTFAIGTAWGVLRYVPENYLSTQLFLLLFFAFYVSIPLAYARQQAVRLKNYVDGTLIFGTPMLGFGLQFSLVHGFAFGAAYSALALGLFYIGLATLLRRQREKYELLSDAFLALGIVFGSLAIPFALDGRWTSAAWALEGAGIVWIGLRQKQKLAWMFGLLVQAGAWISFIGGTTGLSVQSALESNLWLGFLLLSITAFLMATRFRAQPESRRFTLLAGAFLTIATLWLVGGAWTEIFLRLPFESQGNLLVLSALVAAIALYFIAQKMAWRLAAALALAVQLVAGLMLLRSVGVVLLDGHVNLSLWDRPLPGSLMIFAAAIFSSWALMRQKPGAGSNQYAAYRLTLIWSGLWWFALVTPDLAHWLTSQISSHANAGMYDTSMVLAIYSVLVAATALLAALMARRLQWPALRWMAAPNWVALTISSAAMLAILYMQGTALPSASAWIGYATLWLAGEWLLRRWPAQGWRMSGAVLRFLHVVRSGAPWLMIWPVAAYWINRWLVPESDAQLLAAADWATSASWARFVPLWLMIGAVAGLMRRSRVDGWPVRPLAGFYQYRLIPLACAWAVLLVAIWNLTQDGAMAPLPYLPLLNPLDLSTCFALLLLAPCYRLIGKDSTQAAISVGWPEQWIAPLPLAIALFGYGWFNLLLLRSVSHYLKVAYEFDALFASQFVQAMLSLVWSVTALLLMRYAARRAVRSVWIGGASLLALVVVKLFLVDLSNVGGVERIVSFLGVGALMVGIGYIAPYPTQTEKPSETA